jgi:hypothetical protein
MVVPLEECRRTARDSSSKSRADAPGERRWDSSRNALKDALFARVHYLDEENPEAIARLRQRYINERQPRDATEEFLVNQCFLGDLLGQRFERALTTELRRQQRMNRQRWEEERQVTVGLLRDQLVDPETVDLYPILVELQAFGHGLEYLAGEWLRLKKGITTRGFFTPDEMNMGVRLMGVKPVLETVAQHQDAFLFMVWSLGSHPAAPAGMIESLLDPAHRPAGLADATRDDLLPDVAAVRQELIKWVDDELAGLAALADRVAREVDGPELARVLNPAAIVIDPEKAQRLDRAQKNYQSTFYRAQNALEAHHKRASPSPPRGEGARRADQGEIPPRSAREPDIKPPAPDGESAARPSAAPGAVTQIVGDTPDGAPAGGPEAGFQNDPKTGPDRAAANHPGASRSCHKQAANESVGTIVRGSPREPNHGRVREAHQSSCHGSPRCASRTLREDQHHENFPRDRT